MERNEYEPQGLNESQEEFINVARSVFNLPSYVVASLWDVTETAEEGDE